jgi:predicted alpha/beta superfamily hydrolase
VPRQRKRAGEILDLGTFSGKDLVPRRARAYVPSFPPRKRSVLVMLDGQNVFGDEGSFAGGWYAHEAVEKMAAARAPVIVAIDHGGAERIAELGAPSSPKLAAFVDLVVDGVLPALHARFDLGYGPAAHVVCGSSMGGLAALYMHFRRPEVFGGAVAMSPSLWYARRGIFQFVASQTNPYRSRVWLDAGQREAGGRLVTAVESMGRALRDRGWSGDAKGDLRVAVHVDARGKHDEASWRRRLPKALRFAFAP